MHFLNSLTAGVSSFLAHYGGLGLFALSFLDASVLGLPLINDLLLIHLCGHRPVWTMLYVAESTAGSMLGSYLLYYFARAGRRALWRRSSRKSRAAQAAHAENPAADATGAPPKPNRFERWVERNDFVSIVVGSLLPPPLPFKAFPVTAGVMHMDARRFVLALMLGRGLRFGIEGWIGAFYGAEAEGYLRVHFVLASWVSVAVLVVIMVGYRLLAERE